MAEEIVIRLSAEGNAKVEIGKVEKELQSLDKQVQKTGSTFKNIFETGIGVALGGVLLKGFNAATGAAKAFAETLINDSIAASIEQENAISKMNNALAISGEFTDQASRDFIAFSEALQQNSKFADEVILSQLALAKTFGTTNEEAKKLVQAAVDLSAATGVDLDTAVRSLGGSLQGVAGQLGKTIPGIKDLTEEQLKAGAAIDLVSSRFSGSGKNALATYSGAIERTKNTFGDLQEEIGSLITQNTTMNQIISSANEFFKSLSQVVIENKDTFRALVTDGLVFLANGLGGLIKISLDFIESIRSIGIFLADLAGGFTLNKEKMKLHLQTMAEARKEQENLSKAFEGTKKSIDDFTQSVNTAAANQYSETTKEQNEQLKKQSDAAKKAAASIRELNEDQKKAAAEGLALAQALGFSDSQSDKAAKLKLETEELKIQREAQLISEQEFFAKQAVLRQEQFDIENQQLALALEKKSITQQTFDNTTVANQQKLAADLNAITKARTDFEKKQADQKAANTRDSLNTIATLQSSSNKTLFRIGQASAIATATIDGIAAIQKALAVGPPLSFFLVPAVAAAQAANLAKIASAKPPGLAGGIDEVPPGFNNDTFAARLSTGERVVPSKTNEDLKSFLNENQGTNNLLAQLITAVRESGQVMVNVGGETVANVVRRELESGGTLMVET